VNAHVKLSGELSGEYVVDEVFEDGRIVLRPDTSAAAIRERAGVEPVTDDEFDRAFGHLPATARDSHAASRGRSRGPAVRFDEAFAEDISHATAPGR